MRKVSQRKVLILRLEGPPSALTNKIKYLAANTSLSYLIDFCCAHALHTYNAELRRMDRMQWTTGCSFSIVAAFAIFAAVLYVITELQDRRQPST